MLGDAAELAVVRDPRPLWREVFALADAANIEESVYGEGGAALSDGTGVWWAASQLEKKQAEASKQSVGGFDALLAGLQAMPPAHLADEALAEWLHFFAGHKKRGRGQNEGAEKE